MAVTLYDLEVCLESCVVKGCADLANTAAKALLVLTAGDNRCGKEAVLVSSLTNYFVERENFAGLKDSAVDVVTCLADVVVSVGVTVCNCPLGTDKTEVLVDHGLCDLRLFDYCGNLYRACVCAFVEEILDCLSSAVDVDLITCLFLVDNEFFGLSIKINDGSVLYC